jgi:hypothetical protein
MRRLFGVHAKPVFNAEYKQNYVNNTTAPATSCARPRKRQHAHALPLALDFRYSCDYREARAGHRVSLQRRHRRR